MPLSRLSIAALLLFLAPALPALAQEASPAEADTTVRPVPFELEGYWEGAYVRGQAVQRVRAVVETVDDTARIELRNEEWAYYGSRRSPVRPTGDERLAFETQYGSATVEVDSTYREMIGEVGDHEPAITLHLKKQMRPPRPEPREVDVTFESGDATLHGTVVLPASAGPHPGIVFVPGRGCASRRGGVARLRWLAQYGVAGLAYDNRGAGSSDGSCKTSTIETESRDVRAALRELSGRSEVDADRVGLWGVSAAGWYMPHAIARAEQPVAFMISQVGPATSVEGQQKDNAQAISEELGLAPADSAKFLRYVDLMFADDRPNDAVFAEMQDLLAHGDRTGWADAFLVRDDAIGDVPASAAGLDSLWVRRYSYDPASDLRSLSLPVLVYYGADDTITPPDDNAPLMRRLLAGNDDARVAVLPKTGHGVGQGSELRTLSTPRGRIDAHYWKFFRISPDFQALLQEFLETYVVGSPARE